MLLVFLSFAFIAFFCKQASPLLPLFLCPLMCSLHRLLLLLKPMTVLKPRKKKLREEDREEGMEGETQTQTQTDTTPHSGRLHGIHALLTDHALVVAESGSQTSLETVVRHHHPAPVASAVTCLHPDHCATAVRSQTLPAAAAAGRFLVA